MKRLQRYECFYYDDFDDDHDAFSGKKDDGDWVDSEDVAKLEDLCDRMVGILNEVCRRGCSICRHTEGACIHVRVKQLLAELEK